MPQGSTITVVSGVPRSGTSLRMQCLAAAGLPLLWDEARPPDASNPRGYFELAAVKASGRDTSWLAQAEGRGVKVVHALLKNLPRDRRYRVLFMERAIDQVVASQNAMLARLGATVGELPAARVATVLESQRATARELLERSPCFAWMPVSYASLLSDPLATLAREWAMG